MNGNGQQAAQEPVSWPDPTKHVRYTRGMVLGVDDFTQEFAYLTGRDEWLARDLLGYGTVSGLNVTTDLDAAKTRVKVSAGVAVSPRGKMIRVCAEQCATLDDWIAVHAKELAGHAQGRLAAQLDDAVNLYVVLCYRDCPTDPLPIPGEPCRGENEVMAESRMADDFRLELRFDAPSQIEEDAVRAFVGWLAAIEVGDAGEFPTVDAFTRAIREAAHTLGSPPNSASDFLADSPPAFLRIPAADAGEYLRAAFRLWSTELRPLWRPRSLSEGCGCGKQAAGKGTEPVEDCVLLAELKVPLRRDATRGAWAVSPVAHVAIDEKRRPYLVHLRLLQEWLLSGGAAPGESTGRRVTAMAGTTAGLSNDFTRIVALSWVHDQSDNDPGLPFIEVKRLGATPLVSGLVVAFGQINEPGLAGLREVQFGPGSLDGHTFEAFTFESQRTAGLESRQLQSKIPSKDNADPSVSLIDLIPVSIGQLDGTGTIVTSAREVRVDRNGRASANGVALMFSPDFLATLKGREVFVHLDGDLILDFRGLAVDGNFLRARLPSGDGLEGGAFRSWFRCG